MVGLPARLECEFSRADAAVTWHYNLHHEVRSSTDLHFEAEGGVRTLVFEACQLHHAGLYTCQAGEALQTSAQLIVQGLPSENMRDIVSQPDALSLSHDEVKATMAAKKSMCLEQKMTSVQEEIEETQTTPRPATKERTESSVGKKLSGDGEHLLGSERDRDWLERAATTMQVAFEGLPLRKEFHRPSYEQETEQAMDRKQGPEVPLLKPTRTSLQQFLISQQSTDETEDSYASADEPYEDAPLASDQAQKPLLSKQIFQEDESFIYIKFVDVAEAQWAADHFRQLFTLQQSSVEVVLLTEGAPVGGAVVRVSKVTEVVKAPTPRPAHAPSRRKAARPAPTAPRNENAPEFLRKLCSQDVQEGSPVSFDCMVLGSPLPTVRWFKDGCLLDEDDHFMINQDNSGVHQLILTAVSPTDTGVYRCVAENAAGIASSRAELNVDVSGSEYDTAETASYVSADTRLSSREQSEDVLESQAEEEPPEFLQELHDMTLPVGQTTLSLEIRVRGKVYSIPHLDNFISTLLFMSNSFSASLLSSCITWCHVLQVFLSHGCTGSRMDVPSSPLFALHSQKVPVVCTHCSYHHSYLKMQESTPCVRVVLLAVCTLLLLYSIKVTACCDTQNCLMPLPHLLNLSGYIIK
uniref:Ig-like domain-containing protein n=1 Tax=Eptatretus burgeri TaxID=7764 RepID=A0A8C4NJT8_EPTBU